MFGATRRNTTRTVSVTAEKATVAQLMSSRCSPTLRRLAKKVSASGSPGTPSRLGSWPAATVRPTPTLMPVKVAEMLSMSVPSLEQPGEQQDHAGEQGQRGEGLAGSSASAAIPAATSGPGEHGDRRGRRHRQGP